VSRDVRARPILRVPRSSEGGEVAAEERDATGARRAGRCELGGERAVDRRRRLRVARERLARVARRQFGVVSAGQARAAGVSSVVLRTLVDDGVLQRRARGVYAFRAVPDSREARWMVASLLLGDRAVLSHRTAASVHGLPHGLRQDAVHVTVAGRWPAERPGIQLHATTVLSAASVTRVGRLPVTAVPRTLCDVAGELGDAAEVRRLVAAAVRTGAAQVDRIRGELADRGRFAGRTALRAALDELSPLEPQAREELESRFLRLTTRAGVPPTAMNHPVVDGFGRRRELDAIWLPHGVYAELDSRRYHGTLVDWHDDLRRENALSIAGFTVCLRFSWADLEGHADAVVDTIRRALAAV
jgi:predicted transcriptional regulator of viral defense system